MGIKLTFLILWDQQKLQNYDFVEYEESNCSQIRHAMRQDKHNTGL